MREFIKNLVGNFQKSNLKNKIILIMNGFVFLYFIIVLLTGYYEKPLIVFFTILSALCMILLIVSMFPLSLSFYTDIFLSKFIKKYNDKKFKKYDVPFFIYMGSFLPILFLANRLTDILTRNDYFGSQQLVYLDKYDVLSYSLSIILYLLILNIGMYKRLILVGKDYYKQRLDHHRQFIKITLIPVTFAITIIGLIAGFNDIEIKLADVSPFLNYIFFANFHENFLLASINLNITLLIFSLPTLLLGYFFNQCFVYFLKHGSYYKHFFLKLYRKIKVLLSSMK